MVYRKIIVVETWKSVRSYRLSSIHQRFTTRYRLLLTDNTMSHTNLHSVNHPVSTETLLWLLDSLQNVSFEKLNENAPICIILKNLKIQQILLFAVIFPGHTKSICQTKVVNFQEKVFYQTRWEWAAAKLGIDPNHDIDIFIEEEKLSYEDVVPVDCLHISEQLQDIEVIEHCPVSEEDTQAEDEVLDWLTEDWDLDYPVKNSNFWSVHEGYPATYSESTCVKSAHISEEVVESIEDWDVTCPVKQFPAKTAVTETHSSPEKVQPKSVPMLPVTSLVTKCIIVTAEPLSEPMKKVMTAPTKKPQAMTPLRIAAMPAVNPTYMNRNFSRVKNFAKFLNPAKETNGD